MSQNWLIFETSSRVGRVGLAVANRIVAEAVLDESRRHARDLAASTGRLLSEAGFTPTSIHGVMVGTGPGSFTGLRVGIMSAKAWAFATGCLLVAIPTFDAIAFQTSGESQQVDVIADALQKHVYVRRYQNVNGHYEPIDDLRIEPFDRWLTMLTSDVSITGPGVTLFESDIPANIIREPESNRYPTLESIYQIGLMRTALSSIELTSLEPIYLRGSSAEEKMKQDHSRVPA